MSYGTSTIEIEGDICDLCGELIKADERHMITWMERANLNTTLWFRFKTMFGGRTGKAYDAHGQCAADVLVRYIEKEANSERSD